MINKMKFHKKFISYIQDNKPFEKIYFIRYDKRITLYLN